MTATDGESARGRDVDRAIATIRAHGTDVRDEQFERALEELDAETLTDGQRAALERLSDRLVARLLAVPETRLRHLAAADDDAAIERALSLFGSD